MMLCGRSKETAGNREELGEAICSFNPRCNWAPRARYVRAKNWSSQRNRKDTCVVNEKYITDTTRRINRTIKNSRIPVMGTQEPLTCYLKALRSGGTNDFSGSQLGAQVANPGVLLQALGAGAVIEKTGRKTKKAARQWGCGSKKKARAKKWTRRNRAAIGIS